MARGLYRRRKAGPNGKLKDVGAWVIDMRIKDVPEFAGIPKRLSKSSGVFPGQRNGEQVYREMKLMIKELIRDRDAATLRRIQNGTLSLPSVYARWKEGRIHLAKEYADRRVVKEWNGYIAESGLRPSTKVNRKAIVSALVAKGLLTEQTVVNDLPERLRAIRKHYEKTGQSSAFNTIRIELGSFLSKGLGMESDSPFLRDVMRVKQMPVEATREHHPFYTPRECADFCHELLKRPTGHASRYVESVLFMCRHGLRPEEFAGRNFEVDDKTGHLRVRGTKNKNAIRLVPLLTELPSFDPPKIDTLNRMFERMGTPVRCRDFRRTYSIWCLVAQIPENRVRAYMGHSGGSVTHVYQKATPKQELLDADRELLRKWFEAEMKKAPKVRQTVSLSSGYKDMVQGSLPSLSKLQKAANRESKAVRKARRTEFPKES